MANRKTGGGSHAEKPFRNFLYAIYSLLNAAAFTVFFYLLYAVERSSLQTMVMIACGAVAVLGFFVGILRPLFLKR